MQLHKVRQMVNLYLTRHGETLENCQGILQGQTPGHLSQKGIEQSRLLRDQLRDIPFNALLTSDLKRAVDTASILNEPHHLPIQTCSLLRERDWGEFTSKKVSDIHMLPIDFPESVESPEQLQKRALNFLCYLLKNFDGQTVLAVGHGYSNRCILGLLYNKNPHDIPRWGNTEVRIAHVSQISVTNPSHSADSEVSAD